MTTAQVSTRRGHTLAELVISMGAASVLMAGLASSLFIAGRMADPSAPIQAVLDASRVAYDLTDELQYAIYITERSSTMIQFAVADRDGDGQHDVIRYEWSGTSGDPLTRAFNHGTPRTVAEDVREFLLTYDVAGRSEEFPTRQENAEAILDSHTRLEHDHFRELTDKDWAAQHLDPASYSPSLPSNTIDYTITKVEFQGIPKDAATGKFWVQLRPATGDGTPTSTVLEQILFNEADLPSSWDWRLVTFANPVSRLSPDEDLCLVIEWKMNDKAAKIRRDDHQGAGWLETSDAGASWTYKADRKMYYRIYGTVTTPGPLHSVTRRYLTGVGVTLRLGSEPKSRVDTGVSMLNSPELLSAFWKLDFDQDPTAVDADFDGAGDWVRRDGQPFNADTLLGGAWQADATLDTTPGNDFAGLTTIDVRLRDTNVNGSNGAIFAINADWSGGTATTICASALLQADGTQTLTVYERTEGGYSKPLVTAPGLDAGFVDVRIVIDPTADLVAVWVNNVFHAAHSYTPYSRLQDDRFASLLSEDGDAQFDYVSIRVSDDN